MRMLAVSVLCLLGTLIGVQSSNTTSGYCCPRKTVRDVSAEYNGVYTLSDTDQFTSDDMTECKDGCVYNRDSDETKFFCFKAVDISDMNGGTSQCEDYTTTP